MQTKATSFHITRGENTMPNFPDRPKIFHSQCKVMSHHGTTKKDKKENQPVLESAFLSHPGYRPRLSRAFDPCQGVILSELQINIHLMKSQ